MTPCAVCNQVDKAACNYYTLQVSREQVTAGFVVGVHSKVGSRFKLLLFERRLGASASAVGPEQWELILQVQILCMMGCIWLTQSWVCLNVCVGRTCLHCGL